MPKTYLPHQRRKWLEYYEKGKSVKWIANNAKCDSRTVQKGVEEARRDRNAVAAQIELVKEALSDHKDQLLTVVDEVRQIMVMPPDNLVIRTERNGSIAPIPLTRVTVRANEDNSLWVDVPLEETVAWELLKEHLKGDKVWRSYREWKEAVLTHIQARIDLKKVAAKIITNKTGLRIREQIPENNEAGGINSETVQIFYEVVLSRSLNKPDGTDLEKRMVASPDGYVRNGMGGTQLAYAPSKTERCQEGLLQALESLYISPEAENVKTSYKELQEATNKTRRIIEEISLLRMLPGSCRVCRRLGIK